MKSIFSDEYLQSEFEMNGYCVVNLLSKENISEISDLLDGVRFGEDPVTYSIIDNALEVNVKLDLNVRKLIDETLAVVFNNVQSLNFSFIKKAAKCIHELQMHQDWCYTDESRFYSANLWCPLISTNSENGGLIVASGTHKLYASIRSSTFETVRIPSSRFPENSCLTIETELGQAVVFDPRVYHGSHPNNSNSDRLVLACTILEENAPFCFYYDDKNGRMTNYCLQPKSFMRELGSLANGERPTLFKSKQVEPIIPRPTNELEYVVRNVCR